jgi:menaquinone-dependent protoporphyrinogen oxidase
MYTKYNFLIRFVMKRIARQAGASTDTSHDHDYTDWEGLDRILDELGSNVPPSEK